MKLTRVLTNPYKNSKYYQSILEAAEAYEEGKSTQLEACEKEAQEKVRKMVGEIDNILRGALKECEVSNGGKVEYFFVDKLIALKQRLEDKK